MSVTVERMTRVEQLRAEALSVRDRIAAARSEVAVVRANLDAANARLVDTTAQATARLAEITREITDTAVVAVIGECACCAYPGRIEWLPDGSIRVVHEASNGYHLCRLR